MSAKDDKTKASKVAYDILFALFLILALMGICNTYLALKTNKFNNRAILIFYASSILVIMLRVVLFTDQWVDYSWNLYVILLITLPTFMYLITGLSQVMLSVGCTIKYRDKNLDENSDLTPKQRRASKQKNKLVLTVLYAIIAVLMLSIVVLFLFWALYCSIRNGEDVTGCNFLRSSTLTLLCAILNLFVWALLFAATLTFYCQIKGRYNIRSLQNAFHKLFLYLTLFGLSFGFRGFFDLYQGVQ